MRRREILSNGENGKRRKFGTHFSVHLLNAILYALIMPDETRKTRVQLIEEIHELQGRIETLESLNDGHRQTQKEFRRSVILLESSIESPTDMIILSLDTEYRYLYFNKNHIQGMHDVYGSRPVIGDCIFDHITSEDDVAIVKSYCDRSLSGEGHVAINEYGEGQARQYYEVRYSPIYDVAGEIIGLTVFAENVTKRKQTELELESTIKELEQALLEIKTLRGIIPICSYCKVIRNDEGAWEQLEVYLTRHSDAQFSHGICPECMSKLRAEEGW